MKPVIEWSLILLAFATLAAFSIASWVWTHNILHWISD
jgi:hypothetical protein